MTIEEERTLYMALCHRDDETYDFFNITLCQEPTTEHGDTCIEFHIEGDNGITFMSHEACYHLKKEDVDAILDGSITKKRLDEIVKELDDFATRFVEETYDELQGELDEIEEKKNAKEHEEDKWEDNLDDYPPTK